MPDGLPDLWQGYAPDKPEMPTMPWVLRAESGESGAETCLSFVDGNLVWIFLKNCTRLNTGISLKFNISSHYSNILHTVRIQACSCGQIVSSSGILRKCVSQRSKQWLFKSVPRHKYVAAAWRSMKRFKVRNAISRTGIRRWFCATINMLLVTLFIVCRCEQMDP